jgi:hypothetical protein
MRRDPLSQNKLSSQQDSAGFKSGLFKNNSDKELTFLSDKNSSYRTTTFRGQRRNHCKGARPHNSA